MGLFKGRREFNLCGLVVGVATYIVFMIFSLLAVFVVVHAVRLLGWLS
jgi:hypothetical protein